MLAVTHVHGSPAHERPPAGSLGPFYELRHTTLV